MKKTGDCPRGESCPYAHNVFEYWLHPSRYRSQLCNDGTNCKRKVCFFAHTLDELRVPNCKSVGSGDATATLSPILDTPPDVDLFATKSEMLLPGRDDLEGPSTPDQSDIAKGGKSTPSQLKDSFESDRRRSSESGGRNGSRTAPTGSSLEQIMGEYQKLQETPGQAQATDPTALQQLVHQLLAQQQQQQQQAAANSSFYRQVEMMQQLMQLNGQLPTPSGTSPQPMNSNVQALAALLAAQMQTQQSPQPQGDAHVMQQLLQQQATSPMMAAPDSSNLVGNLVQQLQALHMNDQNMQRRKSQDVSLEQAMGSLIYNPNHILQPTRRFSVDVSGTDRSPLLSTGSVRLQSLPQVVSGYVGTPVMSHGMQRYSMDDAAFAQQLLNTPQQQLYGRGADYYSQGGLGTPEVAASPMLPMRPVATATNPYCSSLFDGRVPLECQTTPGMDARRSLDALPNPRLSIDNAHLGQARLSFDTGAAAQPRLSFDALGLGRPRASMDTSRVMLAQLEEDSEEQLLKEAISVSQNLE